MTASRSLATLAMEKAGLTSRYQLAKRLNMSLQRVTYWIDGTYECDDDAAALLAEIAGVPVGSAVMMIAAARSKNKKAYELLVAEMHRLAA